MANNSIETRLVCGFLGAGKTAYISESIRNDYFHKYGTTLILIFEEGEESYDETLMAERKTFLAYYDGEEDIAAFCIRSIETYQPDRIYVEMNTMIQDLPEQLPGCMKVTFSVTLIEWGTMPLYFRNFKQMIQKMAAMSHQVIFRGCPSKELLAPYSQAFRLMNQNASYLRQDPLGYHERAFDRFLPFSLEEKELTITEKNYLPFWLDALDHPEHYAEKTIHFTDPLEVRQEDAAAPRAGRVVMVCCMADLQFMSFELIGGGGCPDRGWCTLDAIGVMGTDPYGRRYLKLRPERAFAAAAPEQLVLVP